MTLIHAAPVFMINKKVPLERQLIDIVGRSLVDKTTGDRRIITGLQPHVHYGALRTLQPTPKVDGLWTLVADSLTIEQVVAKWDLGVNQFDPPVFQMLNAALSFTLLELYGNVHKDLMPTFHIESLMEGPDNWARCLIGCTLTPFNPVDKDRWFQILDLLDEFFEDEDGSWHLGPDGNSFKIFYDIRPNHNWNDFCTGIEKVVHLLSQYTGLRSI